MPKKDCSEPTDDTLMSEAEAARVLRIDVRTLKAYRYKGIGPPVFGYVQGSPRYRYGDLMQWVMDGRPRSHR